MKAIRKLSKAITKRPKTTSIPPEHFVSTGLAPLNMALSGHPDRGIPMGLFLWLPGDSNTGKTWLAMTILAECANNPVFDDHDLVVDMPENGMNINLRRYFGKKLVKRIRAVAGTLEDPDYSTTVQQFYDRGEKVFKRPSVLLLDGMDALESEEEEEQTRKEAEAREKGNKVKGTMGMQKAKVNSRRLRVLCNKAKKSKSILIIISQTRQTIGFGAQYNPRTWSGGEALHFFARNEIWFKVKEKVKEKVGNRNIKIGQYTLAKVVKNHVTGWEGEILIPWFKGVGIDNTGGCIDFLVESGHWSAGKAKPGKMADGQIDATEFKTKKKREALVAYIEDNDLEEDLKKLVQKVWNEIEDRTTPKRKRRYA